MRAQFRQVVQTYFKRHLDLDIQMLINMGGTLGCTQGVDVDLQRGVRSDDLVTLKNEFGTNESDWWCKKPEVKTSFIGKCCACSKAAKTEKRLVEARDQWWESH